MPQIGTCFDEYPYIDTPLGTDHVSYPIVVEGIWWLAGRVYAIEDIIRMCNIPEDEAVFMKLKYGG